jgi:hypothetical protein
MARRAPRAAFGARLDQHRRLPGVGAGGGRAGPGGRGVPWAPGHPLPLDALPSRDGGALAPGGEPGRGGRPRRPPPALSGRLWSRPAPRGPTRPAPGRADQRKTRAKLPHGPCKRGARPVSAWRPIRGAWFCLRPPPGGWRRDAATAAGPPRGPQRRWRRARDAYATAVPGAKRAWRTMAFPSSGPVAPVLRHSWPLLAGGRPRRSCEAPWSASRPHVRRACGQPEGAARTPGAWSRRCDRGVQC